MQQNDTETVFTKQKPTEFEKMCLVFVCVSCISMKSTNICRQKQMRSCVVLLVAEIALRKKTTGTGKFETIKPLLFKANKRRLWITGDQKKRRVRLFNSLQQKLRNS